MQSRKVLQENHYGTWARSGIPDRSVGCTTYFSLLRDVPTLF
jgi:hypothetical protein